MRRPCRAISNPVDPRNDGVDACPRCLPPVDPQTRRIGVVANGLRMRQGTKTPGHTSQSSFGVSRCSRVPVFAGVCVLSVCVPVFVAQVQACENVGRGDVASNLLRLRCLAYSRCAICLYRGTGDCGRGMAPLGGGGGGSLATTAGEAWPRPYALLMSTPGSLKNKPSRGPSPPT